MVLASSLLLAVGSASAHGTVAPQGGPAAGGCTVKSLPSFMAQGEKESAATVGDIIEVSCDPFQYSAGEEVTVTASQLFSRCHEITWYTPNSDTPEELSGRSVSLKLDVNGNANVGLIAGPHCMVGESLITLDENSAPYETFTTSFQVLPTANTPQGLYVTPSSQVEDQETSSVVTIAQVEMEGASEEEVRFGYKQLFDRCAKGDHIELIKLNREEVEETPEALKAFELDNNGNGFVLIEGTESCAEGSSLFEADGEAPPFVTLTGHFKVEAPRVRPNGI
jgi:hypothetical protein